MSSCTCLVQAGQISSEQKAALQRGLADFTTSNFGSASDVVWIEVARGSGYTGGKPSTTSFVSLVADSPLDQSTRAALLRQLCKFWADGAQCTLDEVLAVLADPA